MAPAIADQIKHEQTTKGKERKRKRKYIVYLCIVYRERMIAMLLLLLESIENDGERVHIIWRKSPHDFSHTNVAHVVVVVAVVLCAEFQKRTQLLVLEAAPQRRWTTDSTHAQKNERRDHRQSQEGC